MTGKQMAFGDFVLNLDTESLEKNGDAIHLKPQVFAVLAYLVANAGNLVTRDSLIDYIWGPCEVDFDTNLNTIMRQIRRALDDSPGCPRYIETVPRKGYRLIAKVTQVDASLQEIGADSGLQRRPWPVRPWFAAAALVVAVAAFGLVSPHFGQSSLISTDTQLAYARGKEALQQGDFVAAIALFEQSLEATPSFASAHACLALAHLGISEGSVTGIARAKEQLQLASSIDPDDPIMLTVSAQIALVHEGRSEDARELLNRALQQDNKNSHAYLLSAWQYSKAGNHEKAKLAIRQALVLDPLSPYLNLGAAQIYKAAGDLETAQRFSQLGEDLNSRT